MRLMKEVSIMFMMLIMMFLLVAGGFNLIEKLTADVKADDISVTREPVIYKNIYGYRALSGDFIRCGPQYEREQRDFFIFDEDFEGFQEACRSTMNLPHDNGNPINPV